MEVTQVYKNTTLNYTSFKRWVMKHCFLQTVYSFLVNVQFQGKNVPEIEENIKGVQGIIKFPQ